MKKIIALLLLAAILPSCKQDIQGYVIKGNVKGVEDGVVLMLYGDRGLIAEDTVVAGKFEFRDTSQRETVKLKITSEDEGFPNIFYSLVVYAGDNTTVNVTGDNKLIMTWKVASSLREQDEQNRYIAGSRDNLDKFQLFGVEQRKLSSEFANSSSSEEVDEVMRKYRALKAPSDSVYNYIAYENYKILDESPVTVVWMDQLYDLARNMEFCKIDKVSREQIEELYQRITPEQLLTKEGQLVTSTLHPPEPVESTIPVSTVGDPMPDTDFVDLDGNTHRLADYKGKYILLDFWYRGCAPCLASMPEAKKIADEYKDRLVVVGINIEDEGTWRKASREHDIPGVNLQEKERSGDIFARYGGSAYPYYVMISPEGIILGTQLGYGQGILKKFAGKFIP